MISNFKIKYADNKIQVNKIGSLKVEVLKFLNSYNETNMPKASICFRSYNIPNIEKIYISEEMKKDQVQEIYNMVENQFPENELDFIFDDASKDYQTEYESYSHYIITIRNKKEFQADNKIQVSARKSTNNNPESKTRGENDE